MYKDGKLLSNNKDFYKYKCQFCFKIFKAAFAHKKQS